MTVLFYVPFCQVLGTFLLVVAVRGGHLDHSSGYGAPALSSYGAPVGTASYTTSGGYGGGYGGGSSYTAGGYASGGHGGYDEQVRVKERSCLWHRNERTQVQQQQQCNFTLS